MVGAVVGVAAVLAAGTFAFTQLRSNDSDGGAASPEAVGQQLVTALDNEDILGAVDLLLPGERETFRQPMLDLVDELTRLQVTDDSADLSKVGGIDISITDPKVSVDETNVADISTVSVAGTASVTVDGRDLPIGDFLIESVFNGERPKVNQDSGDKDLNVSFTTVKEGGRWYISLFHTIANKLIGDKDIPEVGIKPVGASTPEGALDNLVQYTSKLDLENIIASLNPNEAAALQRYAPLFLDDAQKVLDNVDITWKISDTKYSVTGSGNRRQVAIDGFHFEAQVNGDTVEFDWADGCLVGTTPNGEVDSCTAMNQQAGSIDTYLEQLGLSDNETLRQLVTDIGKSFSDISVHGVVVDKVDGSWYVSPIGTGAETILSVLRALDRDEVDTLINDVKNVFNDSFGGFEVPPIDIPDLPEPSIPDASIPDFSVPDTVPTDNTSTGDTSGSAGAESWYDCLDKFEGSADVAACIQTGVAAGTFDAEFIPAPFLFPDCGLYDYYVSDAVYTDDPTTFLATIEPGRQCIIDAAASAGIEILYSSPEFVHPECYTKDNPYNYGEPGEVDGFSCALDAG